MLIEIEKVIELLEKEKNNVIDFRKKSKSQAARIIYDAEYATILYIRKQVEDLKGGE